MSRPEPLLISRHCMQELLRNAVAAGNEPYLGLLAGRGNSIGFSTPIRMAGDKPDPARPAAKGLSLMGVFQCADPEGRADRWQTDFIRGRFEAISGHQPECYLVLELGHAGRLDAQAFADAELTQPITLEMQEESSLYPARASC